MGRLLFAIMAFFMTWGCAVDDLSHVEQQSLAATSSRFSVVYSRADAEAAWLADAHLFYSMLPSSAQACLVNEGFSTATSYNVYCQPTPILDVFNPPLNVNGESIGGVCTWDCAIKASGYKLESLYHLNRWLTVSQVGGGC